MPVAKSVDEYLAGLPDGQRDALENLRSTIRSLVPETTETISYQMPTFKYRGRALVGYAAFKNHCSLFPYSGTVFESFAKELAPYRTSKGTIHFTPDDPLPRSLVPKLIKLRVKEIEDREKTRRR